MATFPVRAYLPSTGLQVGQGGGPQHLFSQPVNLDQGGRGRAAAKEQHNGDDLVEERLVLFVPSLNLPQREPPLK